MFNLNSKDLKFLNVSEKNYLKKNFKYFKGFPSLDQMWKLMDEAWKELNCEQDKNLNKNIKSFYKHPVWLLNGLFIDKDYLSIKNRKAFAQVIKKNNPKRVLDYSGGFGSLAREISRVMPDLKIDIFEPYPTKLAQSKVSQFSNIKYINKIKHRYDIIVATDVFEHVFDPIGQVYKCSKNLNKLGKFLIANCFKPIVLCHLPHLFHLDFCWDLIMKKMGFDLGEKVSYGRIFIKRNKLKLNEAKEISNKAKLLFPVIKNIPFARAKIGMFLLGLISKFYKLI